MALFINGMVCQICGKPMYGEDRRICFPAFVGYINEPLWMFNDACFHEDCFLGHPLAARAEERLKLLEEYQRQYNRTCACCHQEIIDPDDHFSFPFFTEDPKNHLYQYNCLQFHKQCLKDHPGIGVVQKGMRDMLKSGVQQTLGFRYDIELLDRLLGFM